MRTRTVEVREGEYLGPVDWAYDFAAWGWDREGSCNPKAIPQRVANLRALDADLVDFEATTDGGWPRCGWGRVLKVGMYDGWPYWKPTPSVLIASNLGSEWTSWFGVSDIRVAFGRGESDGTGEG